MGGYFLIAAIAVSSLSVGYGYLMAAKNRALAVEVGSLQGSLKTCGGRLDAILRDVESDNEIDDLDLGNFDVPDDWLRPEGTATDP